MRKLSAAPLWVCLLRLLLTGTFQPSASLRAGVFEHAQQSHKNASYTPEEVVRINLEFYEKAALFAASKGAELLVFPEYGIFPPVRSRDSLRKYLERVPETGANPCLDRDALEATPISYALSCLARRSGVLLVVNMGDRQPCRGLPDCPPDDAYHYNANVVFAQDGQIIAKYYKEHLFDEPGMDVPPPGRDPTFDTTLGRFATFICFDLVFGRAAEVGRRPDVRAVLLPTMWMNSGPLFNAHQYFTSWAVGNGVALLAANVHLPGGASLGSVVAGGRGGALAYTFDPDGRSKLLLADLDHSACSEGPESVAYVLTEEGVFKEWTEDGRDVGKVCSGKVLPPPDDPYGEYRCLERDMQLFSLERLVSPSGRLESCQGGLCCALEYSADDLVGDYYLGAFNGTFDSIGRYFFAEEDCFVARCDALAGAPCSTFPTRSQTRFDRIRLRTRFSTDFVYPSVVESGMRLAPVDQWTFDKGEDGTTALSLDDPLGKPLLVIGMKARAYSRDPPYVR